MPFPAPADDAPLPADFRAALDRAVPGRWSAGRMERLVYGRDLWPRTHLLRATGDASPAPPRAVLWPERVEELQAILAAAEAHAVPVVPYGGGAGVCGGAMAEHGAVTVDLKRMARVRWTDAAAGLACVEGGIVGQLLEDELGRRGLTLGHFPSSIMCSTLGGFLAARSAGQLSSRYGKIEDMVVSLRAVLPGGRLVDTDARVHAGGGIDWNDLFVGAEGTLGVIADATLRVHPAPALSVGRGFEAASLDAGLEALRDLLQAGYRPAVLRLYDELDTLLALGGGRKRGDHDNDRDRDRRGEHDHGRGPHGARDGGGDGDGGDGDGDGSGGPNRDDDDDDDRSDDPDEPGVIAKLRRAAAGLGRRALQEGLYRPGLLSRALDLWPRVAPARCLLVAIFEGPERAARAEAEGAFARLRARGTRDLGTEPAERWRRKRYAVSFRQSKVYASGAFADTMEVAATWDRLPQLYRAVRRAVGDLAVVMAHFSHAYHAGCSIYFTFAGAAPDPAAALARYDEIWRAALTATLDAGGTVSHHHGVGRAKKAFMAREHGGALVALRALGAALDPRGLMNPGALLPAAGAGAAEAARGVAPEAEPEPSTAAAASVLRAARAALAEARTVVPAGAGTARPRRTPPPGAVVVTTAEETPEVVLDPVAGTVRAGAGARIAALEAQLRPQGWTVRPWHGAMAAPGTIGGALARALAWRVPSLDGPSAERPVALCALLPDGTLFRTPRTPRRAAGPEPAAALLGAYGRTGLLLEVELRAEPLPEASEEAHWRLPEREALDAARALWRAAAATPAWYEDGALFVRFEGARGLVDAWTEAARGLLGPPAAREAPSGAWTGSAPGATAPAPAPARATQARFEVRAPWAELGAAAEAARGCVAEALADDAGAGEIRLFHFGHEGGRVLVRAPAAHAAALAAALRARFPRPDTLAALDDALAAALAAPRGAFAAGAEPPA